MATDFGIAGVGIAVSGLLSHSSSLPLSSSSKYKSMASSTLKPSSSPYVPLIEIGDERSVIELHLVSTLLRSVLLVCSKLEDDVILEAKLDRGASLSYKPDCAGKGKRAAGRPRLLTSCFGCSIKSLETFLWFKFDVEREVRSPGGFPLGPDRFSVLSPTFPAWPVGSLMGILANGGLSARGEVAEVDGICMA